VICCSNKYSVALPVTVTVTETATATVTVCVLSVLCAVMWGESFLIQVPITEWQTLRERCVVCAVFSVRRYQCLDIHRHLNFLISSFPFWRSPHGEHREINILAGSFESATQTKIVEKTLLPRAAWLGQAGHSASLAALCISQSLAASHLFPAGSQEAQVIFRGAIHRHGRILSVPSLG
jgi:hypothetical protein